MKQQSFYKTNMVPSKEGSGRLFDEELVSNATPVTCLGKSFSDDEARRAYFTELLAEKLHDPEFRKIEGFPIGSDEDILKLSDPPYYTACPNPWIADFIAEWEAQKPEKPEGFSYHREPFATDVSEGKNDPIYNAHSYHTKVPHKAIMRYILHYTEPGDIVFDGFCGTGMTGVAAQLCDDQNAVASLGYRIDKDGTIFATEEDEYGKKNSMPFSKIGARKSVLNDLSTVAGFIASNYNIPFDTNAFRKESSGLLKTLRKRIGWMYETLHSDSRTTGTINYTVWSEVFACHQCGSDIVFVDEAFDHDEKKVRDFFPCPSCSVECSKKDIQLLYDTVYDDVIEEMIQVPKRVPVLINYSVGKNKYDKKPDDSDLEVISKINSLDRHPSVPTNELPPMQMTRVGRMQPAKITHIHHFFNKRAAYALGEMWKIALEAPTHRIKNIMLFFVEQAIWTSSVLNRFRPSGYSQVNQYLAGVFYVPSQNSEPSPWYVLDGKSNRLPKAFTEFKQSYSTLINNGDCGDLSIENNSIDYIFTDPPFGENIYYSDLNILIESWHGVITNEKPEAIVDRVRGKSLIDYQKLMTDCFKEYHRVLKAGRWMTVEFHNSKNSVWNTIQEALQHAGFVVADVRTLDKKQGSFQQVSSASAVKQDLVISAYKPNGGLENRFKQEAGTEDGVWDFVRTHLKQLPIFCYKSIRAEAIVERQNYLLFDRMVAFHVQRGVSVPISSSEFYLGLTQRFAEREGMFFLAEQVAEYDKKRMLCKELIQASLFVSDEASAIQWLRKSIKERPQSFQELHPQFMREINGWNKNEQPLELSLILEQNFLRYDRKDPVPEQIHAYLSSNWKELRNLPKDDPALLAKAQDRWYVPDPNKAGDLEKLREKALLKEFSEYRQFPKKLKVFRLEAVRAGFKKSWQDRDYATIITVAEKIPNNVLEEDPKLLMWYDQAITRMGE